MKLSEWASVAEIVSGIAVVVTLIFLVIGIRENTQVARATAFERSAERMVEFRNRLIEDPEVAQLWSDYLAGEAAEGGNAVRQNQLIFNIFQIYEQAYYSDKYGLLGSGEWERYDRQVCLHFERLDFSPFTVNLLTTEFVEYMQASCGD